MPLSRIDQLLVAMAAMLVVALGGIGWALVARGSESPAPVDPQVAITQPDPGAPAAPAASAQPLWIVVDVQGAVVRPGLYHLDPAARVGDAIAAAGGYDSSVDLDAAAMDLNLAARLSDGEKVVVPRLGPADDGAATSGDGGSSDGGLVNVNTADAAELEELPGIGPVTAEKIIAAREEQPFQSLEEMVERDVINNGQLEKIRDLATAG